MLANALEDSAPVSDCSGVTDVQGVAEFTLETLTLAVLDGEDITESEGCGEELTVGILETLADWLEDSTVVVDGSGVTVVILDSLTLGVLETKLDPVKDGCADCVVLADSDALHEATPEEDGSPL